MTLAEFKAWFEGFTESIEGKVAPTQKQWAKIKEKVGQIDGTPITQTIYVDRYVRHWPYYTSPNYWTYLSGAVGGQLTGGGVGMNSTHSLSLDGSNQTNPFNATEAMYALGRAEAMN